VTLQVQEEVHGMTAGGGQSRARRRATNDDDSGLIDLAGMGAVDAHGDPVSGLRRKMAVGRLDAPALPPVPAGARRRGPGRVAVAIVAAFAVIASGAVVVAALVRGGSKVGAPAPTPMAAAPTQAAVAPGDPTKADVPAPRADADQGASEPAGDARHGDASPPAAADDEAAGEQDDGQAVAATHEGKAQPQEAAAERKRDRRRARRRARRAARARDLPDKPSRSQVVRAMARAQRRMGRCGAPSGAVVTLRLAVDGTRGAVRSAVVEGLRGPAASCVARAARRARFPRFADRRFEIRYPIRL
jgi:hypothetical protein